MERHAIGFLGVLIVFSLACGLLDDDATNITYEEDIPFSYTIDADRLCPPNLDCDRDQYTAPSDQQLATLEIPVQIDVVEATNNESLRDYANMFRSVEITRIAYDVQENDLNIDLPPTRLYMGPEGATSIDDEGVVEIATVPEVAAGENKNGTADVADQGRAASSQLLQDLRFATILYAQPAVEEGDPLPPRGSAQMNLTVYVEFTANPQDAL